MKLIIKNGIIFTTNCALNHPIPAESSMCQAAITNPSTVKPPRTRPAARGDGTEVHVLTGEMTRSSSSINAPASRFLRDAIHQWAEKHQPSPEDQIQFIKSPNAESFLVYKVSLCVTSEETRAQTLLTQRPPPLISGTSDATRRAIIPLTEPKPITLQTPCVPTNH